MIGTSASASIVAARICAAGHGGQLLLSQSTYGVLVDDVLPDIRFVYLGQYRLKDIERPEHIYQLSVLDLPHSFPPLRAEGDRVQRPRARARRSDRGRGVDAGSGRRRR